MDTRIITIDGPAGAGKTTTSKMLSKKLNCVYVDTGALYRGVAYEIQQQNIQWENDEKLAHFLKNLDLQFVLQKGEFVLQSYGQDITGFIRTPEIAMLASASSAKPLVRAALLGIQRGIAKIQDAVFEGRDMGTVVFPDAAFKFFLVADLFVRAQRRFDEMPEAKRNLETVEQEMSRRDTNDYKRKEAPLKPAQDAITIDSSHLTIEEVVQKIIKIIENT
ncbi:MAG: (d)CMP kinase [Desulfobacteraceae bacterium]|nr:(d)CMP kinase [Desulfobacteraceae bacterium]